MIKQPKPRKLGFQSLEDRSLMAGDVTAVVSGGNLFITGDDAANNLVIQQSGINSYRIIGAGTTVNHSYIPFNATGVTGGMCISLAGGNDTLTLPTAFINGDLAIGTGAGKDIVNLSLVAVNGNEYIDTAGVVQKGTGNSLYTSVATVDDGAADIVTVVGNLVVGRFGEVTPPIDKSSLTTSSVAVSSIPSLPSLGSLQSSLNGLLGKMGTSLSTVTSQLQSLATQIGNSLNNLLNPNGGNVCIETGGGGDKVVVTGAIATRSFFLDTDDGNDLVVATGIATKALNFDLGGGDDTLLLNYIAAQTALLNGGTGSNKLTKLNTFFVTPATVIGF